MHVPEESFIWLWLCIVCIYSVPLQIIGNIAIKTKVETVRIIKNLVQLLGNPFSMWPGSRMPTEFFTCLVASLEVALIVLPAILTAPNIPSKIFVLFEPGRGAALMCALLLLEDALCVGVELLLL